MRQLRARDVRSDRRASSCYNQARAGARARGATSSSLHPSNRWRRLPQPPTSHGNLTGEHGRTARTYGHVHTHTQGQLGFPCSFGAGGVLSIFLPLYNTTKQAVTGTTHDVYTSRRVPLLLGYTFPDESSYRYPPPPTPRSPLRPNPLANPQPPHTPPHDEPRRRVTRGWGRGDNRISMGVTKKRPPGACRTPQSSPPPPCRGSPAATGRRGCGLPPLA